MGSAERHPPGAHDQQRGVMRQRRSSNTQARREQARIYSHRAESRQH